MENVTTKKCNKCNKHKSLENFSKRTKSKDGLNDICRGCKAEVDRLYRENNLDKIKERNKMFYEENKERILKEHQEEYIRNRNRYLEYQKKYVKENFSKYQEYQRNYQRLNENSLKEYWKDYQRSRKLKFTIENLNFIKNPLFINTPTIVYIIHITCLETMEIYIKPGVTTYSTSFRYRNYNKKFRVKILTEMYFSSEKEAYDFEWFLLNNTKEYFKRMTKYKEFDGYTECRTLDAMNILSKYIN